MELITNEDRLEILAYLEKAIIYIKYADILMPNKIFKKHNLMQLIDKIEIVCNEVKDYHV